MGAVVLLSVFIAPEVAKRMPSPPPTTDPGDFRRALGRVRAGMPDPSALGEKPCPDQDIARLAGERVTAGPQGEPRLWLPGVSYESLAEFVDQGPTTLQRPPMNLLPTREELGFEPTPDAGPDDWFWLDDLGLREVFHPNLHELPTPDLSFGKDREDALQRTMRRVLDGRWLAVLRASSRSMPRLMNRGVDLDVFGRRAEMRSGQSFNPGLFRGGIAVMDIATGAMVCQAALEARSSDVLVYRRRPRIAPLKQLPSAVVSDDFKDRFREAAKAAMARVSKLLATSWR